MGRCAREIGLTGQCRPSAGLRERYGQAQYASWSVVISSCQHSRPACLGMTPGHSHIDYIDSHSSRPVETPGLVPSPTLGELMARRPTDAICLPGFASSTAFGFVQEDVKTVPRYTNRVLYSNIPFYLPLTAPPLPPAQAEDDPFRGQFLITCPMNRQSDFFVNASGPNSHARHPDFRFKDRPAAICKAHLRNPLGEDFQVSSARFCSIISMLSTRICLFAVVPLQSVTERTSRSGSARHTAASCVVSPWLRTRLCRSTPPRPSQCSSPLHLRIFIAACQR